MHHLPLAEGVFEASCCFLNVSLSPHCASLSGAKHDKKLAEFPKLRTFLQTTPWTKRAAKCKGIRSERRKAEFDSPEKALANQYMLSRLGQSFNSAGIAFTLNVIFKEPHLALPHIAAPDVSWIDWNALKQSGFQGVVFDKDNTITAPYAQHLWPSLSPSIENCRTVFNGQIAVLSNSAGLYQYDPDDMEAKTLESTLGIPVIRHRSKKPAGSAEDLEQHFGCNSSLLVMVGDRYFTDVVYGNKNGLLTVLTKPLTRMGDPLVVRQVRALEDFFVQRWYGKGVVPMRHRFLPCSCRFIKELEKERKKH